MELLLGYHYDILQRGFYLPYVVDLASNPHVIMCGASGSGKTYAIVGYIDELLSQLADITIVDYKSELYHEDCKLYHGLDSVAGIYHFYDHYRDSSNWQFLIVDEYPALIGYYLQRDKKLGRDLQNMLAEILMMGRSRYSGVILVAQRPDAHLFASGARDNFGTRVLMGKGSTESQIMLFGTKLDYTGIEVRPGVGFALNQSNLHPIYYLTG